MNGDTECLNGFFWGFCNIKGTVGLGIFYSAFETTSHF